MMIIVISKGNGPKRSLAVVDNVSRATFTWVRLSPGLALSLDADHLITKDSHKSFHHLASHCLDDV